MAPFDEHQLKDLGLAELVHRMDELMLESVRERYGQIHDAFPVSLVSDIVNSQKAVSYTHLTLPTNREV